ncbi:MAG: aldolase/citrate lyase family protein [Acidobacteria bacterium]|nr:aldolase/citrate lyase family protein [Acidobacteriota bacterium]
MVSLKSRLASQPYVLGTFVQIPSPQVVEILGLSGFDFVVIDNEHGAINPETTEQMIRAAEGVGLTAMVRVPQCDPVAIRLPLDWGAAGVHVPQIESTALARTAARSARFFPHGERGLQPYVRSARYRSFPTSEYLERTNQEVSVVVHIEGRGGVTDLEEILALDGIDVAFLGPYDLSQALGIPGQVADKKVENAILEAVRQAGAGRVIGTYADTPEIARRWIDSGVRYVTLGIDAAHLLAAGRGVVSQVKYR